MSHEHPESAAEDLANWAVGAVRELGAASQAPNPIDVAARALRLARDTIDPDHVPGQTRLAIDEAIAVLDGKS